MSKKKKKTYWNKDISRRKQTTLAVFLLGKLCYQEQQELNVIVAFSIKY